MRVGQGFDVHRLTPGRKLILGGVEVPFEMGLLGHSDADVLTHAIMDALLGAVGAGDIGVHFPDRDPVYQDADSLRLLKKTAAIVAERHYTVANIDATIIAERPKLADRIPAMRRKIAAALDLPVDRVSIKATTTEGLGYTGRGEGMAALAVALVKAC